METRERLEAATARLLAAADTEDMATARAVLGDLLRDFVPDGATMKRCDVCGRDTLHAGDVCGRDTLHAGDVCARCSTWPQWQAAMADARQRVLATCPKVA